MEFFTAYRTEVVQHSTPLEVIRNAERDDSIACVKQTGISELGNCMLLGNSCCIWVWHFGIWVSRHGGVGWIVGLHDLRGLFQPMTLRFCCAVLGEHTAAGSHGAGTQSPMA